MESFMEEFQRLKIQLEEIKSATNNFNVDNVIGKGGFGNVYKGSHFRGKSMVAFKRLDRKFGQGDNEFWKEIMMLSRYTHENLISLLGFCDESGEKILVYEYASNGSLDLHLSSTSLTWTQRIKICLKAARGISYLHDDKGTKERVLHRDIKSSNILLDELWNPKVSDMGLSKIGPANKKDTVVITNVVGTIGYLDPIYLEVGILTKESDVYAFGVVLFEVLCGRVCFEKNRAQDGSFPTLVRKWKQSYKQKKLDEITFEGLMQQTNSTCLETFSDIAFQCVKKSRKKRPTMAQIVQKLENALESQEIFESMKGPIDCEEIIKNVVPALIYGSKVELDMLLSKGVLLNDGKTWFSLNENREHCEMISAAACLNDGHGYFQFHHPSKYNSRFPSQLYESESGNFNIHVRTRFLTPLITYTVNLVFKVKTSNGFSYDPVYVALKYNLEHDTGYSTSYVAVKREDKWSMVELYQLTNYGREVDLKIQIKGSDVYSGILVEGIEFRPLERVQHEVSEDENLHMLDSDTDWEEKLPADYSDIIKLSKDLVQWTTKKGLYSTLSKGLLINNGEEWFSLDKNGKKCLTLSARAAWIMDHKRFTWQSLPESRFGEAVSIANQTFIIDRVIKHQVLSPQTTYASYLVYKIMPDGSSMYTVPVKVMDKVLTPELKNTNLRFIYLTSLKTPVIRRHADQNTSNQLDIPKRKGFPEERRDGWMEVQVGEFRTGIRTRKVHIHLEFATSDNKSLRWVIIQGLDIRPL